MSTVLVLALALPATAQGESRSGYDDVPSFGGPGSVGADLREDDEVGKPWFRVEGIDNALQPWFDFKGRLNENYGFSFGLDYTALVQALSDSPGEDVAAGGIARLFGNWTLLGHNSVDTGSVVFKVENRHRLGTDVPPQQLGFEAGYLGFTGLVFSDYDWALTRLHWRQRIARNRFSFVIGTVDVTDYVGIYGLTNPWTHFGNRAFLTDPTIPAPSAGLGTAFRAMITDNIGVLAGLADTNGDPTEPGDWFDTFFDDHEYFYHVGLAWAPSQDRIELENIKLTGWYVDERTDARVDNGWGLAFSAARAVDDKWMPFLRAGYAHDGGALLEASVSAGVGYYFSDSKDLVGLGLNWGRPSASGLDDQYTAELFYRLQLAQRLAVTPSVQLLVDPALNPDKDVIGVFGLRARLAL